MGLTCIPAHLIFISVRRAPAARTCKAYTAAMFIIQKKSTVTVALLAALLVVQYVCGIPSPGLLRREHLEDGVSETDTSLLELGKDDEAETLEMKRLEATIEELQKEADALEEEYLRKAEHGLKEEEEDPELE